MTVLSIKRDFSEQPNIVRIETDDSAATIATAGYLEAQTATINALNGGFWRWYPDSDMVLIQSTDDGSHLYTVSSDLESFILYVPGGGASVTPQQIQNEAFTFGPDTGVADAYIVALTPSIGSYIDGLSFRFVPANNNTSTTPTLDAGAGALTIVGPGGAPIMANDIVAQVPSDFVYYNGNFYLQNLASISLGNVTQQQVQGSAFNYGTDTGAVNAYAVDLTPAVLAYTDGLGVIFNPLNTNTSVNITIDVNGLGPKVILTNDILEVIQPGDLFIGSPAYLIYSSSLDAFQLLNPQSASQVSSAITSNNYNFAITSFSAGDNYTATIEAVSNDITAEGSEIYFRIDVTNSTNAPQLAVSDAIGNSNSGAILDSNGNGLLPGQLQAGFVYSFIINSAGNWICTNPSGMYNISSFAGDPNTNVAGNLSSLCIDTTNDFLYYCSTAGDAAGAAWTKVVV